MPCLAGFLGSSSKDLVIILFNCYVKVVNGSKQTCDYRSVTSKVILAKEGIKKNGDHLG